MSRSDITVKAWRRAVFASKDRQMTAAVKVLCLYLADHMRGDRKVSVPRDVIARDLACHPQRIAERFGRATRAGFLVNVNHGYPGRTAEYQGTWPNEGTRDMRTAPQAAMSSCRAVPISEPEQRGHANMRTAPRDAISRADLSAGADEGDVEKRSNEEQVPLEAPVCLDVCEGDLYDEPCQARCRVVTPIDLEVIA